MTEVLTMVGALGSLVVVVITSVVFGIRLGRIETKLEVVGKLERDLALETEKRHKLELVLTQHVVTAGVTSAKGAS